MKTAIPLMKRGVPPEDAEHSASDERSAAGTGGRRDFATAGPDPREFGPVSGNMPSPQAADGLAGVWVSHEHLPFGGDLDPEVSELTVPRDRERGRISYRAGTCIVHLPAHTFTRSAAHLLSFAKDDFLQAKA
jgi:hypothetical protein